MAALASTIGQTSVDDGFVTLDQNQIDALARVAKRNHHVATLHDFYESDIRGMSLEMSLSMNNIDIKMPDWCNEIANNVMNDTLSGMASPVGQLLTYGMFAARITPPKQGSIKLVTQSKLNELLAEFDIDKALKNTSRATPDRKRKMTSLQTVIADQIKKRETYATVTVLPLDKLTVQVKFDYDNGYTFRVFERYPHYVNGVQVQPREIPDAKIFYMPQHVDGSVNINSILTQVMPSLTTATIHSATYTIMTANQSILAHQQISAPVHINTGGNINPEQAGRIGEIEIQRILQSTMTADAVKHVVHGWNEMLTAYETEKVSNDDWIRMRQLDPLLSNHPLAPMLEKGIPLRKPPFPLAPGTRIEPIVVNAPDPQLNTSRQEFLSDVVGRYGLSLSYLRGEIVKGDAYKSQQDGIRRFSQRLRSVLQVHMAAIMEEVMNAEIIEMVAAITNKLAQNLEQDEARILGAQTKLSVVFVGSGSTRISVDDAAILMDRQIIDPLKAKEVMLDSVYMDASLALPIDQERKLDNGQPGGGAATNEQQQQQQQQQQPPPAEKPKPAKKKKEEEDSESESDEEKEDKKKKTKKSADEKKPAKKQKKSASDVED